MVVLLCKCRNSPLPWRDQQGSFPGNEHETGHLAKQVDLRGPLNLGSEEYGISGTRKYLKTDLLDDGLHLPGGYFGTRDHCEQKR